MLVASLSAASRTYPSPNNSSLNCDWLVNILNYLARYFPPELTETRCCTKGLWMYSSCWQRRTFTWTLCFFHSCRFFCVMFSFRWMDCRCSRHRFRIGWKKRRWMYLMCWLRPTSTVCCNWACYPPLVFCHCWYWELLSWAYTTIAWSVLWMIINILWWQPNALWKKKQLHKFYMTE